METEIEDALHHMLIILSISRLYLLPPWNHFHFVYFFVACVLAMSHNCEWTLNFIIDEQ